MNQKTIQLLCKQDAATQKQVYYAHCDRLMAVVYHYLESVADAEEVLQDAFVTIFSKIKTFDPQKGSFTAWTNRIAINHALMFLRKQKRMVFTTDDLSTLATTSAFAAQTGTEDIQYYIDQLPKKAAIVFRLKVEEGYSHQEIAALLQIKTDASRTIFSRARKKLHYYLTNPNPSS